ncbi:MAG: caspase family protein [Phycisphaeraceae bacterium]|nr:caspase family protein [Phycisphaeraceae bacterium]
MSGGNIYGLFIGINRYESEDLRPLAFASADVLAVRDLLAERFGLRDGNAVIIADGVADAASPTRLQILRAMDRFASAPMQPSDLFMFVFAGHGFCRDGRSFLATCDSVITSESMLLETAVSLETVRRFLGQIPAGQQVLILDACRVAPVTNTRSIDSEAMSSDMTRDIGAVIRPSGPTATETRRASAILCSCWEGQVAYEYTQAGHGWFCHNLLEELDQTTGPELSLANLYDRVRQRMQASAWRLLPSASKQSPHLLIDGDIPVLRRSSAAGGMAPTGPAGAGVIREPAAGGTLRPAHGHRHAGRPEPACHEDQGRSAACRRAEEFLLAGDRGGALHSLAQDTGRSPRAVMLRCIATLVGQPLRKLRNDQASALVATLTRLEGTSEVRLVHILLLTLAEHYYRPLHRRMPCPISLPAPDEAIRMLDRRSRQLASLVPEAKTLLVTQGGAT